MEERKVFLIFDSNSLIHRAFHALPPLTTKEGEQVGAVYGFLLTFFRVIKDFSPGYTAAAFDYPAPTFRHKEYKEYKAKRPPAPPDLYKQIPKVKEVLEAFGVPIFEKEGFEADDIIGTLAKLVQRKQVLPKIETIIISGDLDTLQLIDENTRVYMLRRGIKDTVLYNKEEVGKRYEGILPDRLINFKALRGDPSDNIPGVRGIGEKTAIKLIKEFESIEDLYKALEEKSLKTEGLSPKLKQLLIQNKEEAFFSKRMVTINREVPVELNLEQCRLGEYKNEKAIKALEKLGFYTLIKRMLQ